MTAIVLEDLDWSADAMDALERAAKSGQTFDAYDLSETYGLRQPPHPNQWGSLFRKAAQAGLIFPVDFHKSKRPKRAGGRCLLWLGTTK